MTDDPRLNLLMRDEWAGLPATRGSLPRVPSRPELPTASEALAGCLVRIPGGSGVADATYECQKQADGTYAWVQVDAAAPSTAALPKGKLAWAAATASTSFTASEVDVAGMAVTVNVGDGSRLIRISAFSSMKCTSATQMGLNLYVDTTTFLQQNVQTMATNDLATFPMSYVHAPSAGTHAYKITASGTGNIIRNTQAYILVEDIGAAV